MEYLKNIGIGVAVILGLAVVGFILLHLIACGYTVTGNCGF